jgi:hypothetical protein
LSFRNISTVIVIDRKTGNIIWKLGAPPLSGQHAPMPLLNGNLLLFDNGPHRLDHTMPFSRIIEVDLATKQIVWKYQEKRESDFFSPRISNAQRLPNGNTLICEGDRRASVRMINQQILLQESSASPQDQPLGKGSPELRRRAAEDRREQ